MSPGIGRIMSEFFASPGSGDAVSESFPLVDAVDAGCVPSTWAKILRHGWRSRVGKSSEAVIQPHGGDLSW